MEFRTFFPIALVCAQIGGWIVGKELLPSIGIANEWDERLTQFDIRRD